jgi:hypothetical protein
VILLALVLVAVVLAMPVIYWTAVIAHVSLYQIAPATLVVLVVGVALFLAICVAWARAVREARVEAVREANSGRIFGAPGGVLAAAAKFGQGRVEAGAKGEESTAVLLELLLRIPGTTVYHGLQFPGNDDADVDHAVAFGNFVYLLDSKLYRAGDSMNGGPAGRRIYLSAPTATGAARQTGCTPPPPDTGPCSGPKWK